MEFRSLQEMMQLPGEKYLTFPNGYNGLIYSTEQELTDIIIDINENPNKYLDMGINARSTISSIVL
jgi:hypothetical protein